MTAAETFSEDKDTIKPARPRHPRFPVVVSAAAERLPTATGTALRAADMVLVTEAASPRGGIPR
jgi:hypothetical protein